MEKVDPVQLQADEVLKTVKGPLHEAIRNVERLAEEFPLDKDFHFYSNFSQFKGPVQRIHGQVESLLNGLGLAKNLRPQAAEFPSDPEESYDWLVALQDDLVEGIDTAIDQFNKEKRDVKRGKNEIENEAYQTPKKVQRGLRSGDSPSESVRIAKGVGSSERGPVPFHVRSIPRPQDKFDVAVDNSNTPFKHPQPAASKSDNKEGISALDLHARKLGLSFEDIHPLETQLKKMEYVDEALLESVIPQKPRPLAETPLTMVSTLSELNDMAAKLRAAQEFAVDLEHHHYRSYQGFVCLMQVSIRSEDFIVDTLALRSNVGSCLKEIFADPGIRKVMHGADHDIVWLQRDFGIYVCNMFDTGQAARVLKMEGFGLAFLLQHFLDIHPDKRYQLADWRIRPLLTEMIKYAREDTHYLLYIYDMLRVQLVSMRSSAENDVDDALLQVYKRSRDVCLQIYKKEVFTETSYLNLYGLHDKQFSTEQMAVLAGLYAWRDRLARKEDESTGYVLPNQLLYKIAEEMPQSARELHSLIRAGHTLLRQNVPSVLEVIRQSKEQANMPTSALQATAPGESKENPPEVHMVAGESRSGPEVYSVKQSSVRVEEEPLMKVPLHFPVAMEEEVHPRGKEIVDRESAAVKIVLQDAVSVQKGGSTSGDEGLKSVDGERGSLEEINKQTSLSNLITVTKTTAEDTSVAPVNNTRRSSVAVVRRASAPSLALFGSKSKKRPSVVPVDLDIHLNSAVPSARPAALNSFSSFASIEATKSPSVSLVGQDTSETADVRSLTFEVEPFPEGNTEFLPFTNLESVENNQTANALDRSLPSSIICNPTVVVSEGSKDSAIVVEQDIAVERPVSLPVDSENKDESISKEITVPSVLVSLEVTSKSVVVEQEKSEGTSVVNTSSKISPSESVPCSEENLRHACSVSLTARHDVEGVDHREAGVGASRDFAAVTQDSINLSMDIIVTESTVAGRSLQSQNQNEGSKFGRTPSGPCQPSVGLGAMLGSSGRSKGKRGRVEDKEMAEAKSRADQIRASLSLPFHRVFNLGAQVSDLPTDEGRIGIQAGSESVPCETSPSELPACSLSVTSSGGNTAEPEKLEDLMMLEDWDQVPEESSSKLNKHTKFFGKEESDFPKPLSDFRKPSTHQQNKNAGDHKRGKKQKQMSFNGQSEEESGTQLLVKPFDYSAARKEIGLGDNLTSRVDDSKSQRGRGRGMVSSRKRQQRAPPPRSSNGGREAFDPLRRVRQEPRPEGIPAAKRRQVFPQTGNRSASFRR